MSERVAARLKKPSRRGDTRHAFIAGGVRALGVTQARWIADYFRMQKKQKDDELQPLIDSGELIRVDVRGWDRPGYAHRDHLRADRAARNARACAPRTRRCFRRSIRSCGIATAPASMFDFDYTIECYTPAPKRKFGYFVLPILRRGELVGRLDAKAHRADGVFEVKAIYLEPRRRAGRRTRRRHRRRHRCLRALASHAESDRAAQRSEIVRRSICARNSKSISGA